MPRGCPDATACTGCTLGEHLETHLPSSVCGLYLAHPEAAYDNVGPLGADQLADYAARQGVPMAEAERWLAPVLGYEPAPAETATTPSGDGLAARPALAG